jgi:hypothetical protein
LSRLLPPSLATPGSAEQEDAYGDLSGLDDLERARHVWIRLTQGRIGTLRRTGWRFDTGDAAHTSMPARLPGYLDRMYGVAERLARQPTWPWAETFTTSWKRINNLTAAT